MKSEQQQQQQQQQGKKQQQSRADAAVHLQHSFVKFQRRQLQKQLQQRVAVSHTARVFAGNSIMQSSSCSNSVKACGCTAAGVCILHLMGCS
jgi:hypothetical protein